MDTLDLIHNIIRKDALSKWKGVQENIELFCNILPGSIPTYQIAPNYKGPLTEHLSFDSENEKLSTINYITEYLNKLQITYNNVLFMAFSQMEAILKHIIKQMNKLTDYAEYANSIKSNSYFINMFNFIVQEKKCVLNSSEKKLFSMINKSFRPHRNHIAHDIYQVFTIEDTIKFISDGINIENKLLARCSKYIDNVNIILNIVDSFFMICKKYFI